MNEQQIRWDDLQIVLAIAESGSLSGASRSLRVSHATVFRRLSNMEQQLGVALFERNRTGYTPTLAGDDLAASAKRVQTEVHGAERRIVGQDVTLTGSLRITTTDTLFAGLLSPLLARFRQQYPEITLEVAISNQLQSLSRREADIAIRPTRTPPDTLVGKKLANITQAIYGQKSHWQHRANPIEPRSLETENWIGPDVHLGDTMLEKWMMDKRVTYKIDSMLGMQLAARQGVGITVLPCYLGDTDDTLIRLTPPIDALTTHLWLLTHPDLRHVTRIRVFRESLQRHMSLG
ncbi:LysR family transcriptional regulator [Halomonas sp. A020]|jgi:molybdate transport repressor ModE-like protein|uniref:LysR family transcriptional regulator n=1 Tax=Halomonadaceae TaxID=28256 RepID=UPI001E552173|nr:MULTISPECIES: LysR family transcriptional regulator [Halomonas]MCD1652263.1 LysR family transcriptional regulator [Halomonas axialensis]MCD2088348.1 LysR family transcriptional regulator [Halomonas meridiana]BCB59468.1 LysR family transcriptional regulator [Halomonas sp. A020]